MNHECMLYVTTMKLPKSPYIVCNTGLQNRKNTLWLWYIKWVVCI